MRFADLPAADRRAIRAGQARAAAPAGPAASAFRPKPAAGAGRPTHRCEQCGRTFSAYPPAERHTDADHGAGRISLLL